MAVNVPNIENQIDVNRQLNNQQSINKTLSKFVNDVSGIFKMTRSETKQINKNLETSISINKKSIKQDENTINDIKNIINDQTNINYKTLNKTQLELVDKIINIEKDYEEALETNREKWNKQAKSLLSEQLQARKESSIFFNFKGLFEEQKKAFKLSLMSKATGAASGILGKIPGLSSLSETFSIMQDSAEEQLESQKEIKKERREKIKGKELKQIKLAEQEQEKIISKIDIAASTGDTEKVYSLIGELSKIDPEEFDVSEARMDLKQSIDGLKETISISNKEREGDVIDESKQAAIKQDEKNYRTKELKQDELTNSLLTQLLNKSDVDKDQLRDLINEGMSKGIVGSGMTDMLKSFVGGGAGGTVASILSKIGLTSIGATITSGLGFSMFSTTLTGIVAAGTGAIITSALLAAGTAITGFFAGNWLYNQFFKEGVEERIQEEIEAFNKQSQVMVQERKLQEKQIGRATGIEIKRGEPGSLIKKEQLTEQEALALNKFVQMERRRGLINQFEIRGWDFTDQEKKQLTSIGITQEEFYKKLQQIADQQAWSMFGEDKYIQEQLESARKADRRSLQNILGKINRETPDKLPTMDQGEVTPNIRNTPDITSSVAKNKTTQINNQQKDNQEVINQLKKSNDLAEKQYNEAKKNKLNVTYRIPKNQKNAINIPVHNR